VRRVALVPDFNRLEVLGIRRGAVVGGFFCDPRSSGSRLWWRRTVQAQLDLAGWTARPADGLEFLARLEALWGCVGDFLGVGWPIGSRRASDVYVRDTAHQFAPPAATVSFQQDARLPKSAANTGYRSDGWHLWIDERGRGAVFLVRAGRVERWPQMLIGCA